MRNFTFISALLFGLLLVSISANAAAKGKTQKPGGLNFTVPQEGDWKMHTIHSGPSGADGVKLADINGDGRLDVVAPFEESGSLYVHINPGQSVAERVH